MQKDQILARPIPSLRTNNDLRYSPPHFEAREVSHETAFEQGIGHGPAEVRVVVRSISDGQCGEDEGYHRLDHVWEVPVVRHRDRVAFE